MNFLGVHNIHIQCWRPRGTHFTDAVRQFFLGTSTNLKNGSIIFDQAWQKRHELATTYSGKVSLNVCLNLKPFREFFNGLTINLFLAF